MTIETETMVKNGLVTDANGTQAWYVNDRLLRIDGPAIIHASGTQRWYVNGQRHRLDGPAIIHASGTQEWYENGQLHRTDGPAVIGADGSEEWYVRGVNIAKKVKAWMENLGILYPFDDNTRIQFILTFGGR